MKNKETQLTSFEVNSIYTFVSPPKENKNESSHCEHNYQKYDSR